MKTGFPPITIGNMSLDSVSVMAITMVVLVVMATFLGLRKDVAAGILVLGALIMVLSI